MRTTVVSQAMRREMHPRVAAPPELGGSRFVENGENHAA
jgi:hypothetical protein